MEVRTVPNPPTGVRRLLWRLPIHLYRMHLGRLLGSRVMLLTHTGRVTGKQRKAVIEVVEKDHGTYIAASGFGTRADWYRNILATPDVTVQVAGRTIPVTAAPLTADDGGDLMARYAPHHPSTARRLCRVMGFDVDGSEADYRSVGERIPFIRFTPRT